MWALTFFLYYRKRKCVDAGAYLMLLYLFLAVTSLLVYNNDFWGSSFGKLNIGGFAYLYIMFYITTLPVFRFNITSTTIHQPNLFLTDAIAIFFIVTTFIEFPNQISNISEGLTKIFLSSADAESAYHEGYADIDNVGKGVSNIPRVLSNMLSGPCMLMAFYYLYLNHRKRRYITIGLFVASFIKMFGSFAAGQRGGAVGVLLLLLVTYFLFKNIYIEKVRKVFSKIFILVIVAVSLPIMALTIARFEQRDALGSVWLYTGQANIYFDMYGLDNNGIRYGDETFPLIKKALGFSGVPDNYMDVRNKYPHLKINNEVFVSYVGDFTFDYGPVGGAIVMLLLSLLMIQLTRPQKKIIYFHQLILLHMCMKVCGTGSMKLFPFMGIVGNVEMIAYILVALLFWFDYNMSVSKRRNRISVESGDDTLSIISNN